MKCPICKGTKVYQTTLTKGGALKMPCEICNQTGKVSFKKWLDVISSILKAMSDSISESIKASKDAMHAEKQFKNITQKKK